MTDIYFDRTRVTTDWTCPRQRFWAFEFGRRGLSPKARSIHLEFGGVLHESIDRLFRSEGRDLEGICEDLRSRLSESFAQGVIRTSRGVQETRVTETLWLAEGMIRGFARIILPPLLQEFQLIDIERELTYRFGQGGDCVLASKPDLLLERRSDGALFYYEWKTTGSMSAEWFQQWQKAVQLPAGLLGVLQTLGRELTATKVVALNKGYYSSKTKRQESIFCYGYGPRGLTEEGMELEVQYRHGQVKHPVWLTGRTPKEWSDLLPDEVLRGEFGETPPIFFNKGMTEAWLRQTEIREREIARAREQLFGGQPLTEVAAREVLDATFPQRFKECRPPSPNMDPCPYNELCWIAQNERDPLASGLYEWRVPHHTTDPVFGGEQA